MVRSTENGKTADHFNLQIIVIHMKSNLHSENKCTRSECTTRGKLAQVEKRAEQFNFTGHSCLEC